MIPKRHHQVSQIFASTCPLCCRIDLVPVAGTWGLLGIVSIVSALVGWSQQRDTGVAGGLLEHLWGVFFARNTIYEFISTELTPFIGCRMV